MAIVMKRPPAPSAATAAMFPCRPAGMSSPTTNDAQSGGSNVRPGGSFWVESTLGSIPLFAASFTLQPGAKPDFTCAIFVISAEGGPSEGWEQPANRQTLPI